MLALKVIDVSYKLSCGLGTACVIYFLFAKYLLNDDASIITMKKFKHSQSNSFPTVTICLKSTTWGLYNNQYLLSSIGLNGSQYRGALLGIDEDVNLSSLIMSNFLKNTGHTQAKLKI